MVDILELDGPAAAHAASGRATRVLEKGGLILFPNLPFVLSPKEAQVLDPAVSDGRSKNISLDPSGRLSGAVQAEDTRAALTTMIDRFAQTADALLAELAPRYGPALQRRRTSFRPGAIAGRALSRRKDDRRLHVDAFPANPVQGRRILRVFANVHPAGEERVWNLGEQAFEDVAIQFRPKLTAQGRTAALKSALGVTRGRQTPYDQLMLQLHDAAKLDDAYQAQAPHRRVGFPAGGMWVVYTDAVMHAALSGQHALEQTYLMPTSAMEDESLAPLRILERMTGRRLT